MTGQHSCVWWTISKAAVQCCGVCLSKTSFMNNVYGLFCIACLQSEEDPSGSKCCKKYDEVLCIRRLIRLFSREYPRLTLLMIE